MDVSLGESSAIGAHNSYCYCRNIPLIVEDSNGTDVVLLLNTEGASGFGHLSLLIQDKEGMWWYYYYGAKNRCTSFLWFKPKVIYAKLDPENFTVDSGKVDLGKLNLLLPSIGENTQVYDEYEYIEMDSTYSHYTALTVQLLCLPRYNVVFSNCKSSSFDIVLANPECVPTESYVAILEAKRHVIPNKAMSTYRKTKEKVVTAQKTPRETMNAWSLFTAVE